ncbi:MAG: hypothetical protein ABSF27_08050 [Candidatus Dormibacteria bacterium]|jgi:hypothetical protein
MAFRGGGGFGHGGTELLVLLVLLAALLFLVLRAVSVGRSRTTEGAGTLPPGQLAYHITMGVITLVAGCLVLVGAALVLLVGLVHSSLGPGPSTVRLLPILFALLLGLVGGALVLLGRSYLVRL